MQALLQLAKKSHVLYVQTSSVSETVGKKMPISCHPFLLVVAGNADIIITCAGVAS